MLDVVTPGSTFGVGSLPHLGAGQAAQFSFDAFDIATMPNLPRRSRAEEPEVQALVGVRGITVGRHGEVDVDCGLLDPDAPVVTDLDRASFVSARRFLDEGTRRGYTGPVKWQQLGPVSLGLRLIRAGAATDVAFDVALAAVRQRLAALAAAVSGAMPASPQLVVLDEPFLDAMTRPDFPIAPDHAIDLLSGAMAELEPRSTIGLHSCAPHTLPILLAAGPHVVSVPLRNCTTASSGYIERFLAGGGWIAWGSVSTTGPIGVGQPRGWQRLSTTFCELVQAGCDAGRLRAQCLITPECGLSGHGNGAAHQVVEALRQTSLSMQSESSTARYVLGA